MAALILMLLTLKLALGASPGFTLEQLSGASLLLRHAVDSGKGECGFNSTTAQRLLRPLHPLWDAQVRKEAAEPAHRRRLRAWERCICDCVAYSSVIDAMRPPPTDAETARVIKKIHDRASAMSPASVSRCAKRAASWFCGSRLRRTLEASANEFEPDPSQ